MVTWESIYGASVTDSQEGIFGQIFDASGAPVGAEFHVNNTTAGKQSEPELIALDDGRFVSLWHDTVPGDDNASGCNATMRMAHPIGTKKLLKSMLCSGGMPNNWQAIGLEDRGLAALWRNPATGELYVQSFDTDGSALSEVTAIQTGSHTTS